MAGIDDRLKPILDVWEQYKHLDILLSDEAWMIEEGHPMSPQRRCLYDLWKAIKEVVSLRTAPKSVGRKEVANGRVTERSRC